MSPVDINDVTALQPPFTLGSTLPARSIKAIVEREQGGSIEGVPYGNAPRCTITVKNHATEGILSGAAVVSESAFDTLNMSMTQVFLDTLGAETITYYPNRSTFDSGKDTVALAMRPGEIPTIHKLGKIISIDKGMLTLEVR